MSPNLFLHLIFFINNTFSYNLFWITRFERFYERSEFTYKPFVWARGSAEKSFVTGVFLCIQNCDRGGLKPDDTFSGRTNNDVFFWSVLRIHHYQWLLASSDTVGRTWLICCWQLTNEMDEFKCLSF